MYQKEIAALGGTDGEEWHTRLSLIDKLQNIVILARGENICFMNAIGLGRLGYSEITPLLGYPVTGLFHHDYEQMSSLGLSTLAEESMIPLKILRRNGETIEVELYIRPISADADAVYMIEAKDITEHLRAARALRSREQWLEGIIKSVADGIVTVDHRGMIQSFNPAAERIFRFRSGEVIGREISALMPKSSDSDEHDPSTDFEWQRIVQGGADRVVGLRKDGAEFPLEVSFREMIVGDSVTYTGVVRDITDRQREEDRIRHLANHDALTGLPNRALMIDRLDDALRRSERSKKPVALIFVDLNRFKPINDTHGHAAGDRILVGVGENLVTVLRKVDTVARVGGDEFVVIIEDAGGEEQLRIVCHKILAAVNTPVDFHDIVLQVTCSLGIAVYPDDATNRVTLLDRADKAMYKAKATGEGCVCRFPDTTWSE